MIERWELIQAQSLSEKHRQKQNLQQWQQLISDLQTMRAWLGQSEAELSQLRGLDLSTDIHTIQQRIKKMKVCLLRVCVCLVSVVAAGVCLNNVKKNSVFTHIYSLYSILSGTAYEVQLICSNLITLARL